MTSSRREPPPLTFARLERAWRGQPIDGPDELEGPPPPPPPSTIARRINWALAAVVAGGCLFAVAGFVFPIEPAVILAALGGAAVTLAVHGFRTHRTLGVAFRSRFIARREREPALYWTSLTLIWLWGGCLLLIAWSMIA